MGTVPANFHGVKGKSGRKSMPVEIAKAAAIRAAWNKVAQDIEKKDTEKIALPVALRDMVAKVGNADGSNLPQITIYAGKSLLRHDSDSKDIQLDEQNKGSIGGDFGIKNNINPDLVD